MELNIKFDEKMLVEMANRVLDEYEYKGKTIREWADLIAHPKTKADLIRTMSDEELAKFFAQQEYRKPVFDGWLPLCNHVMGPRTCHENGCENCWLDWLKQEAEKTDE